MKTKWLLSMTAIALGAAIAPAASAACRQEQVCRPYTEQVPRHYTECKTYSNGQRYCYGKTRYVSVQRQQCRVMTRCTSQSDLFSRATRPRGSDSGSYRNPYGGRR